MSDGDPQLKAPRGAFQAVRADLAAWRELFGDGVFLTYARDGDLEIGLPGPEGVPATRAWKSPE